MNLSNEKASIEICDVCDPKKEGYQVVLQISKGKCLVCERQYCESKKGSTYFNNDWLPYDLRTDRYPFCGDCAKKIEYLKPQDWKEVGIEGVTYSGKDQISKLSYSLLEDARNTVIDKLSGIFKSAIEVSKKRYTEEIEKKKRKAELDEEIAKLEKQKLNIQNAQKSL